MNKKTAKSKPFKAVAKRQICQKSAQNADASLQFAFCRRYGVDKFIVDIYLALFWQACGESLQSPLKIVK